MVSHMPTSKYGRGFIVNITHLKVKFSLPPEQAWPGIQDYLTELILPTQFKGTEVETLTDLLRQKVVWHQAGGPVDKEMYTDVKRLLNRIIVAIDKELGIENPDIGQYHA
ncbi:hypothetical protein KSK55_01275 [Methanospirillum purgamenti]|jgi:hypothetical protein|uniref:Uncharacterized protein n=2 Tax=Methanospirillum TaxID=2202 RepID=A0A8F5VP39_METHU|nr:hypothetical protein [Methanomicrobiales archaeon]QXO95077.1 hypothetical protein KSK55_01275 [Methanospirillum hungatei]